MNSLFSPSLKINHLGLQRKSWIGFNGECYCVQDIQLWLEDMPHLLLQSRQQCAGLSICKLPLTVLLKLTPTPKNSCSISWSMSSLLHFPCIFAWSSSNYVNLHAAHLLFVAHEQELSSRIFCHHGNTVLNYRADNIKYWWIEDQSRDLVVAMKVAK